MNESDLQGSVWVVTGAAGFIGSHLTENLLRRNATVCAIDNFATGKWENIRAAAAAAPDRLTFVESSIEDETRMASTLEGADYVLHQAALGSVPRSMEDPLATHRANVNGFLAVLNAARNAGVKRMVYASSSSVYGDHQDLPKREDQIGRQLSPYAASKRIDEIYSSAFRAAYGFRSVGMRYFNVFGPRQDPEGAYAAVIPRWFKALHRGERVRIFGDGETSRDFCHVANVVQANIRAALVDLPDDAPDVFNIAAGRRVTLTELFGMIRAQVAKTKPSAADSAPYYEAFRSGDVRHSLADITEARQRLGYEPTHFLKEGLEESAGYYAELFSEMTER